MLGSKLASTTYDPDKVWLSVEYPDSVRGSAKKLKQLLDALRSDTMVSLILLLNQQQVN